MIPPNPEPSIGRIVHVVMVDRVGDRIIRPGLIVRTFGAPGQVSDHVNAQVFVDGTNDLEPRDGKTCVRPCIWKTGLRHDPTGQEADTWHWPART